MRSETNDASFNRGGHRLSAVVDAQLHFGVSSDIGALVASLEQVGFSISSVTTTG
ncbi:MAG: hypothetical protein ACRDJV_15540 [Actinomycetota bacterium]